MGSVGSKRDEQHRKISEFRLSFGQSDLQDDDILSKPISELHDLQVKGELNSHQIWQTFTRKAIDVHQRLNCLTELVPFAETPPTIGESQPPLAGVPVSIKDNFGIAGLDASIGYPARCHKPIAQDSPLIRLLKDAGAVLYTKTNVPTGMLSILSSNPVWGMTLNHHGTNRTPGGSSSGEAALISAGGSRVGIGTDIGGSVRVPAHLCGIYSLRFSSNRFPRQWINDSSTPGFEGIPDVSSPLGRTIGDLRFFIEGVMAMKPWEYCYQLLPLPWRKSKAEPTKPKKVGIVYEDKLLKLTPPVKRALDVVADALRKNGVEVMEYELPHNGAVYDKVYASLILADGFQTAGKSLKLWETSDPILDFVRRYSAIPKCLRWIVNWILKYVFRFSELSLITEDFGPHTTTQYYEAVVKREELRLEFWQKFKSSGVDVLVTPPLPTPALDADYVLPDTVCNYSSMFNLLDYPAGVIPVTTVDSKQDELPADFDIGKLNDLSQFYFKKYDAREMHGLPVGAQIVGMRYEDEKVLGAMEYIDDLLRRQ